VFAYLVFFGSEIPILEHLSDILPVDLSGNITLDETDVMRIYTMITMGLMMLSLMGKGLLWGLKQLIKKPSGTETEEETNKESQLALTFKAGVRRLVISTMVITIASVVLFIALRSADLAEGASLLDSFLVPMFFYVLAMVMNVIHVVLDSCSNLVLQWAISNITWWFVWRPDRSGFCF
jgi:hypothetical protein